MTNERDRQSATGSGPLAVRASKLAFPISPRRHLPRPRLTALLDDGPVVLLSAPAGYGKTSVLAEWAAQHQRSTAWLTIDDTDDAAALSAGILAALRGCPQVPVEIPPPTRTATPAGFLSAVETVTAALAEPVTLVLDDVHEAPLSAFTLLEHLIRYRPGPLRLVLATRHDPPVPLARLRLSGELQELRAEQLALRPDEAEELCALTDVPIDVVTVHRLVELTGGWIGGLRLALLSLGDVGRSPETILDDLVGSSRPVADYLISEILSHLPEPSLHVLRAASVCELLDAELAAGLTGRDDAGDVLDALVHATGLVSTYGAGQELFRIHPLLKAHLQAELRRRRPGQLAELHGRAAACYLDRREPVVALPHLVAAGYHERLAEVLRVDGLRLVERGHQRDVSTALAGCPTALVEADPQLVMLRAVIEAWRGELTSATLDLQLATALLPAAASDQEIRAQRRASAWLQLLSTWRNDPPADGQEPDEDGPGAVIRAAQAIADGRLDDAESVLATADPMIRGDGFLTARALAYRSAIACLRGRYREMVEIADRAEELGAQSAPGWADCDGHAVCAIVRADGALLAGDPQHALDVLADFRGRNALETFTVVAPLMLAHTGAARHDLGERSAGAALLDRAREVLDAELHRPEQVAAVALLARSTARSGERDRARTVLGWSAPHLEGTTELAILRAGAAAAISRFDVAHRQLGAVADGSLRTLVPWSLIEAGLLTCAIALRTGQQGRAHAALHEAVEAADRSGALRPLVLAPEPVAQLLARHANRFAGHSGCAREALQIRRARSRPDVALTLTPREREILLMLRSLHPLDEIADELTVSVNTVKTHVKALYSKMGAHSRRDAVRRAESLGLLP